MEYYINSHSILQTRVLGKRHLLGGTTNKNETLQVIETITYFSTLTDLWSLHSIYFSPSFLLYGNNTARKTNILGGALGICYLAIIFKLDSLYHYYTKATMMGKVYKVKQCLYDRLKPK